MNTSNVVLKTRAVSALPEYVTFLQMIRLEEPGFRRTPHTCIYPLPSHGFNCCMLRCDSDHETLPRPTTDETKSRKTFTFGGT